MGMTLTNSFLILNFWCHQFWLLLRVMVRGWGWGGGIISFLSLLVLESGMDFRMSYIFRKVWPNRVRKFGNKYREGVNWAQTFDPNFHYCKLCKFIWGYSNLPPSSSSTSSDNIYLWTAQGCHEAMLLSIFWGELCALTVSRSQCSICWLMTFYWWLQSWATC